MWTTGVLLVLTQWKKYSKMTNKWRHASRNPCIFAFLWYVRQKHKQWQKVINLQVSKKCIFSRHCHLFAILLYFFCHFGDMCEKNDKVLQQMTNKYKFAGCKNTFFSRHCHLFAILLSCFVFFVIFDIFPYTHTYIHKKLERNDKQNDIPKLKWQKHWQTNGQQKWQTKSDMTKNMTQNDRPKLKWQKQYKTMAKTTTNKWQNKYFNHLQGMATSFF